MNPFILRKNMASIFDLKDGASAFGLGVGNIYYVVQTSNDSYTSFVANRQFTYADGTSAVQATPQAALDACVSERNDYVVLLPDTTDYDLTTALTMTKRSVHLIGAGGMTGHPGATNSVRVHQNGAYACVTVTGNACEISGIFWKGYADKTIIELSAAAHACNIHHNFVGLTTTAGSATAYGIHGSGESTNLTIADNYVTVYQPTASQTIGGGIVLDNGTRALIANNIVSTGGFGQTLSVGIGCSGAQIICLQNWVIESKCGTPASSTLSIGIQAGNDTVLIENRVSMAVANIANAIAGMHADCAIMNYGTDAAGGDTILA